MIIPRLMHHIWLGKTIIPKKYACFIDGWKNFHPDWNFILWNEGNVPELINANEYSLAKNAAQRADVVRYEIIFKYGGVYVDTDFECLKCIEPLIDSLDFFSASEKSGLTSVGIFGATPGHKVIGEIVKCLPESLKHEVQGRQDLSTGPGLMTSVLRSHPNLTVFGPELFYPYHFTEMYKKNDIFPDAYAIHHWASSWKRKGTVKIL